MVVEYEGAVRLPFCLGAAVSRAKAQRSHDGWDNERGINGKRSWGMLPFLFWMYEMKISFQSDPCMISFSIPSLLFFFFLLLIVWLPPYCCNMLPLWSRSRGGFPCSYKFMKQEEVPRGQGAGLKHFHPLFSLFRCSNNNKHWCCCEVNMPVIVPYISLPGFLLSTGVVYPQCPGAVERKSSLETLQSVSCWDAEMLHFAPMSAHICLHSPVMTNSVVVRLCLSEVTWLMTFWQT